MWETWVRSLGREDPLEKEMATHSSILAWRIPWTEELGGLQSMGRKESDTTERLHFHLTGSILESWRFRVHAQGTATNSGLGASGPLCLHFTASLFYWRPDAPALTARSAWVQPLLPWLLLLLLSRFSHVWFSATLWIAGHQAPLSMGFSRQVYWSGLPLPSPGDLPDPGIKPGSPALQEDSLPTEFFLLWGVISTWTADLCFI